jgi:hypothetical protein
VPALEYEVVSESRARPQPEHDRTAAGQPRRIGLHHCQGDGKVGAERIAEAAAATASAAPRSATALSRRSRSATQAISKDNPTTAPRKPRSTDKRPRLPTIRNSPPGLSHGSLLRLKAGRCRVGPIPIAFYLASQTMHTALASANEMKWVTLQSSL